MGSDGRASDGLVVDGPFANWDIKYTRNPETKLTRFLGVREVRPARTGDLENAYGQTKFDQAPYDSVAEVGFRPWGAGWWSVRGSREVGGATLHSSHHGFIGGSNGRGSSPNDPTFWLAHSFNDGYWYEWQNVQLARFPNSTHLDWYEPVVGGPTGHNLNDVIVGLDRTIAMTLDHADLAYTYDENIPSATICPFGNLNACISYCSAENYETCAEQCSSFC
jgi:tyrosinase